MKPEQKLITQIESCKFTCDAGPLELCTDWEKMKELTNLWVVVKRGHLERFTRGQGGWAFEVYTNKDEAQSAADSYNCNRFGGRPLCEAIPFLDLDAEKYKGIEGYLL